MKLKLDGWRGSSKVLGLVNLSKEFTVENENNRKILMDQINLQIWHGERVGLVGPNGTGKSVLFNMILDKIIPNTGEIIIGPSIKVGYYSQEHDTLDFKRTLIETVRFAAPLSEGEAVNFLGRFLFGYEQCKEKISTLSGGEKSRLQMALLMLSKSNFLLLDEPTNNLDIPSAEVLESALDDFEGSIFVISHDRYFLDRVVDRIVELNNGNFNEFQGGYSDYLGAER